MTQPLVSIITPSYNQEKFIEDNILSVKRQTYKNIEHIIIDGGSADNTVKILKKHQGSYNMRWISEKDEGQSDGINKGLRMAKGGIIGWINSDDAYLFRSTISAVVNHFMRNPKARVIYGGMVTIDNKNKIDRIYAAPLFNYAILLRTNFIFAPSVFFTRDIAKKYAFDKRLHYVMDYDLWLRVGANNAFHRVPDITSCFRYHEKSKSTAKSMQMITEEMNVRKKYLGKSVPNPAVKIITSLSPILKIRDVLGAYDKSDFALDVKLPSVERTLLYCLLGETVMRRLRK